MASAQDFDRRRQITRPQCLLCWFLAESGVRHVVANAASAWSTSSPRIPTCPLFLACGFSVRQRTFSEAIVLMKAGCGETTSAIRTLKHWLAMTWVTNSQSPRKRFREQASQKYKYILRICWIFPRNKKQDRPVKVGSRLLPPEIFFPTEESLFTSLLGLWCPR